MAAPVTQATQKISEQKPTTLLAFEEEIAKVKRALAEAEKKGDDIESRLWSAQRYSPCSDALYDRIRDEQDASDAKIIELKERLLELESKKPFTLHLPPSQLRQRKK